MVSMELLRSWARVRSLVTVSTLQLLALFHCGLGHFLYLPACNLPETFSKA